MYDYNAKQLLDFFQDKIAHYTDYQIIDNPHELPNFIGQGISRTVFYFNEYPDIVFKLGIGETGIDWDYSGEVEIARYEEAKKEDVACFFSPIEYIGDIVLYSDEEDRNVISSFEEFDRDDYGDLRVSIGLYIQPKIDFTWSHMDKVDNFNKSFQKEKRIISHLYTDKGYRSVAYSSDLNGYFLRKYGLKEYFKLSKFLDNYNITDLHNENWAVKDTQMVIIDYAM